MSAKRTKKSKAPAILGMVLLLIATIAVYKTFGPNTGSLSRGEFLYIHTNARFDDVQKELEQGGYIGDMFSFNLLAKATKYPEHVHAGKYKISRGMSNFNIIRMLRSGHQTPVKLVINKLRTRHDFIHLVGTQLEADSNQLFSLMTDSTFLAGYGLDTNTAMCAIMPDTYEFFWNTNAEHAFEKIAKSYHAFWTDERRQQAQAKNLTVPQATTIASIVEEETNKNDEKPLIASVYLNRLHKGMLLQADPTVKFAVGDFTIKRITGAYLGINSPYNTYKFKGLPPGPICTPSKKSIEAVLQAPDNSYLYFCAKEDFSGYHNFATNLADHMKNARAYQQALDARGIH
ncbi:MAG: endolytic transglycosylase MltG [Bacteroidetes bacterium]|nr:endolytic transglycosylase MltG [Bacteroidota bacterium]